MRIGSLIAIALMLALFPSQRLLAKSDLEKEIEKREDLLQEAQKRREKLIRKMEKENKDEPEKLGKIEISDEEASNQAQEISKGPQKAITEAQPEQNQEAENSRDPEEIEKLRAELKANEEKALNFIFQSEELEADLDSSEKFFSKTEKEQLLELWRSTLARNRTIQFVIRSLSTDPENYEKNNAVMQVLSRALFVPFYAISAVSNNSLLNGGSALGARVIGDVVDSSNEKRDRTKQVTRTDMIVLFMLVDEVAERLRNTYQSYKELKVARELFDYELKLAKLDLDKSDDSEQVAGHFAKMVMRDIERKLRENKLSFRNSQRKLIELAGEEAVNNVDLLIDLEIDESLGEILGV